LKLTWKMMTHELGKEDQVHTGFTSLRRRQ